MAHGVEARRVRRSAEEWRGILAQWVGSGLTQAEFCRRRGLSLVTFGGWQRHFRDAPGSSCPRGAAVGGAAAQRVARLAGTDRPAFVEVATRPRAAGASLDPAGYEVRLANGRAVRVGPAFDPATLRRLLAIVDSNDIGHAEGRVC